jgi:ligand-binding SRPBCC domain-containing protein
MTGPYRLWRHTHRFSEHNGGTLMADAVQYALPVGALGQLIHRIQVAADLSRIFDYRSGCIRARFSPAKGGSVTIREASLQSATTS